MTKYGNLPEEWIASYAAGQLSDAKSMFVATHISYRPQLQQTLRDAEEFGGNMLETIEAAPLADSALDQAFSKIDKCTSTDTESLPQTTSGQLDTPAPLAELLQKNLHDLKWRFMGPGMKQIKLWSDKNGECLWLLRARGGTEIPVHDHRGTELTMVLQGSYHVGDQTFKTGDVEIADTAIADHQPLIGDGEDCICLVVTDAPIRLHSVVGRLFQPFIGL